MPTNNQLTTPIYLKTSSDMPWPRDRTFFLLTSSGMFLCRNHPFYTSSVPAPNFPSELDKHKPFLNLRFPRIPRRLFELAVGFCTRIYAKHQSEAGLLLVWSQKQQRMRLVCPPQVATVSVGRTGTYPIGLHYQIPPLADDDLLIGDLHSHGDESAYASGTDKADEAIRGGTIHIVVGRCGDVLIKRPPHLHIDMVIDRTRFTVEPELVVEGYHKPRMGVPQEWLDAVQIKAYGTGASSATSTKYVSSPYYNYKPVAPQEPPPLNASGEK